MIRRKRRTKSTVVANAVARKIEKKEVDIVRMMIGEKIDGAMIRLITMKKSKTTLTLKVVTIDKMKATTRNVSPTKTRLLLVEKLKKLNIKQSLRSMRLKGRANP